MGHPVIEKQGTIASTMADKYIITLKQADKQSEILEQASTSEYLEK